MMMIFVRIFTFSPAHTIAQFAKKALSDRLPGGTPSKAVISGFLFVCRQLYNTCDGLMVLNHYELHQHVANAWMKVSSSYTDAPLLDFFNITKPET